MLGLKCPEKLGRHHPPHRMGCIHRISVACQHWTSASSVLAVKPTVTRHMPDQVSPHATAALSLARTPKTDRRQGREEHSKDKPPATAVRGAPAQLTF